MVKTADVVPGAAIVTTWGNEIRDRTAQVFATAAERDAQWPAPPAGALAYTADTGTLWLLRGAGWEVIYPPPAVDFVYAGLMFPTTDPAGRFNVILPGGGHLVAALAAYCWVSAPTLIQWDANVSPPGGNYAQFVAYTLAGAILPNAGIGISFQVVWNYTALEFSPPDGWVSMGDSDAVAI